MNQNEQMQRIWKQYEVCNSSAPASSREVAQWAIDQGLWTPPKADIVGQCAEAISKALREEYRTDKYGRRYRAKHAVRHEQHTFWADIDTAPRQHMEKAFAQRRQQIIGDCHQLKTDVDYYNGAHPKDAPVQLILDFSMDIAEIEALEGIKANAA